MKREKPRSFFTLLRVTWLFLVTPVLVLHSQSPRIDSIKGALDTAQGKSLRMTLLNDLSSQTMAFDAQKAFEYAQQAFDLSEETDLKSEQGRALNYMGSSQVYLNQFEKASEYYLQAKDVFQSIDDQKGVADIVGNLGNIYHFMGEYNKALEFQFEALEVFEELNNQSGLNNTHMAIGAIYMENGDLERALYYDSLALDGFEKAGDENGAAIVSGNMANIYTEMDQLDKAENLYVESISVFKKHNDLYSLAREQSNLSTLYEQKLQYKDAIQLSLEAAENFQAIGYGTGYIYAIGNVGGYYLTSYQQKTDGNTSTVFPDGDNQYLLAQAEKYLKEAVETARNIGDRKVLSLFSETLSTTLEEQGNLSEAYVHYKTHREIKDSIESIELKEQLERLTTERELAVKDKQIELDRLAVIKKRNERAYFLVGLGLLGLSLIMIYRNFINQKKSNIQLGAQNHKLNITLNQLKETQNQLIESERQKERAELRTKISQDIHDDISSGLTKISWLSERLRSRQSSASTDLDSLIEKISQSSRATVSKLGEIIWSTNPGRDNVSDLLNYIREQVSSFLEGSRIKPSFDFDLEPEETTMNPELRRNLYLVCKEAVNNAFKYSGGDSICIRFQQNGDTFLMSISDNGKGIKDGVVEGGGNGLNNMRHRLESVGGTCSIESDSQSGTTVTCTGKIY